MAQKNVYKPRYKIAYQAKSKVWPYKNSRLRGFYSIRGRRLIRRGLYRRYFMVMNSMKWTIARRVIRPHMRRTRAVKRRFRDAFYTKQQLRRFYGKVKEEALRNFFRNHLTSTTVRNRAFFSSLERRLDMVIFRMRLLPTIFAAHQLVHHQGVLINGARVTSPNALVGVRDVVAIRREQWQALYWDLYYRVYWRRWGLYILRRRQYTLLKKKLLWIRRMRQFFRENMRLKRHLFKTQQLLHALGFLLQSLRLQLNANMHFKGISRENIMRSLDNLSHRHRSLLFAERRAFSFYRNELSDWSYRHYFANLLSLFAFNRTLSKSVMNLVLRAKLLELQYHSEQVLSVENLDSENFRRVWGERLTELLDRHRLWSKQLDFLYRSILRIRLRRLFYSGDEISLDGDRARPRPLLYFLARRRSKEERRRRIPRLKAVHWYIPSYMLFDFRTLRAVIVEAPRQEQIYYSFHCSLSKVHSFYRAMGL